MTLALPTRVRPGPPQLERLGPGGSAWTYLDLVDAEGNGLVLISSVGLPFLPGYASAARSGRAEHPLDHPSLVLSTIVGGRPDFYALHRFRPGEGPGEIAVTADGALRVEADLRGTLPGCDWEARISVVGAPRIPSAGEPTRSPHEWTVLSAGAEATAVIRAGDTERSFTGRAYVDRNLCETSLDALGVSDWHWGRVAMPDGDLVWYSARGPDGDAASLVHIGRGGETTDLSSEIRTTGVRYGRWGLARPAVVHLLGADVHLDHPIDDSPFYTRLLLSTGGRTVGFAEACRTDRIDQPWMRPLVRMAVAGPGPSSVWLPLFCGPRQGRIARLFRSNLGLGLTDRS